MNRRKVETASIAPAAVHIPIARVRAIAHNAGMAEGVFILGIRGVTNIDSEVYRDTLTVVSPTVHATFNANTDPSNRRRGVPILKPGLYWAQKGKCNTPNNAYDALVQASPLVFGTDDREWVEEGQRGHLNAFFHRGWYNTTSVVGAQTVYPDQWLAFLRLVYCEMDRYGMAAIRYCLVNQEDTELPTYPLDGPDYEGFQRSTNIGNEEDVLEEEDNPLEEDEDDE